MPRFHEGDINLSTASFRCSYHRNSYPAVAKINKNKLLLPLIYSFCKNIIQDNFLRKQQVNTK